MCQNKMRFPSNKEARKFIKVMLARPTKAMKAGVGSFKVYHCDDCDGWHLTTCSNQHSKKIRKAKRMRNEV